MREFINVARVHKFDYNLIEAFDQPFKAVTEGAVGAFWGVFDAEGKPKFDFTGTLTSFEQWATYAGIAVMRLPPRGTSTDIIERARTLIAGLAGDPIDGRLWIVEAARIREYRPEEQE